MLSHSDSGTPCCNNAIHGHLAMSIWRSVENGITLALRVVPKARKIGLGGTVPGADGKPRLKISVSAPADKGQANEAVRDMLAKALRVPASRITLLQGLTARDKLVRVEGDPETLGATVATLATGGADS
ncbi:putative cytosolic protein [Granulibacter bethesdensis]|nr:putative cytosolic protein [Granulibacter bethesdensis]